MKKLMVLLTILVIILGAGPVFSEGTSAEEMQNEPSSFRGIKFGDSIEDLPGMEPIVKKKGFGCLINDFARYQVYVRPSDSLNLGDLPLDFIEYYFYEGSLAIAVLSYKSKYGYNDVLKALETKYGEPKISICRKTKSRKTQIRNGEKLEEKSVVSYYFRDSYEEGTEAMEIKYGEPAIKGTVRMWDGENLRVENVETDPVCFIIYRDKSILTELYHDKIKEGNENVQQILKSL